CAKRGYYYGSSYESWFAYW
nr:immunoglobulin heavy chain junction region [Mus musculus]